MSKIISLSDATCHSYAQRTHDRSLGMDSSAEMPVTSSLLSQAPRIITFDRPTSASPYLNKILASMNKRKSLPRYPVSDLLSLIYDGNPPPMPEQCIIEGVFFPGHLLYQGWWNRGEGGKSLNSGEWRGKETQFSNVRRWLNAGYEQWGPSWDLSISDSREQYLFGQIGSGDEANSLHVIIAPSIARKLRADMEDALAVCVEAQGTLCNDQSLANLSPKAKRALSFLSESSESSMRYFLLIEDHETNDHILKDKIEIVRDQNSTIYSAYFWQSLVRESHIDIIENGRLHLPDTIYLWEHTNLLDHDCIKFNYDAISAKKKYLEKILGEKLIVQHHSYFVGDIVGGLEFEPVVSTPDLLKIIDMTRHGIQSESNIIPFPFKPQGDEE